MHKATITVTLRPAILDPQGKATHHALSNLGFTSVQGVRVGKFIELAIDETSSDSAEEIARAACEKLLANPVMEDFEIEVSAA